MTDKQKKKDIRHGIPCSPEGLKEFEKTWKDIDDSITLVYKRKQKK